MPLTELRYQDAVEQLLHRPDSPVGPPPRPVAALVRATTPHTCDVCECRISACSGGTRCCL